MDKGCSNICFLLGDKLPTTYDVAIDLFSLCTKPGSEKMNKCIAIYANALIDQWTKAFGEGFTLAHSAVTKKISDIVLNYHNHVYIEQFKTESKKKGVPFIKKTLRQLNKDWKQSSMSVMKNRKKTVLSNNSLLDIGTNMDVLTGEELIFYTDQCTERVTRISVDVDLKYVEEKEIEYASGRSNKRKCGKAITVQKEVSESSTCSVNSEVVEDVPITKKSKLDDIQLKIEHW